MKAWRLDRLGGDLAFQEVAKPEPRPGSVLVRIEAAALMSYLQAYVAGKLPFYNPPPGPFTIGTNGVGIVEAVGRDVWGLQPGRRVILSSHFVARENVEDPAQTLIGLTAGAGGEAMLADWPDGTLAEYALMPAGTVTPLDGVEDLDPARLAGLSRFIVPFGGLLRGRLAAGETLVVNGATVAYGRPRCCSASRWERLGSSPSDATRKPCGRSARRQGPRNDARAEGRPGGRRRAIREAWTAARISPSTWSAMPSILAPRSRRLAACAPGPGGADGQHDDGPSGSRYPAHAEQLGDPGPVHVSATPISGLSPWFAAAC